MSIPYPSPLVPYTLAIARSTEKMVGLVAPVGFTRIIDFRYPRVDLAFIKVGGDVVEYNVVPYDSIGVPPPEDYGSGSGLVVKVAANGTAYIMASALLPPGHSGIIYTTVYAIDADVNVSIYPACGWTTSEARAKLPKYLKLPKGQWARYTTNWYGETHHGEVIIVIEINNPNSSWVNVVIGCIVSGILLMTGRGHLVIWGWEGNLTMNLNNETVEFTIQIFLPEPMPSPANIVIGVSITGDGTNSLTLEVTEITSGLTMISLSNSSTTPVSFTKPLNILHLGADPSRLESVAFHVKISTSGTGTVNYLWIAFRGYVNEFVQMRPYESSITFTNSMFLDPWYPTRESIAYAKLSITNSSNVTVGVTVITINNQITVANIAPNETRDIEIPMRCYKIMLAAQGTATVYIRGYLLISECLIV